MDWLCNIIILAIWFPCGHCVHLLTFQRDQLASPNPIYLGHRLTIKCRLSSDELMAQESHNDQGLVRANIKKIKYIYIGYETSKDSNKWHRIAHITENGRVELGMFPNLNDHKLFGFIAFYKTGRGLDLALWVEFDVKLIHYQKYMCLVNLQTKLGDRSISTLINVTRKLENIVTINPITIGEPMEVRCSVNTIGGIGQLHDIGPHKILETIKLSRKIKKGNTVTVKWLASYWPIHRFNKRYSKDLPKGVTPKNFKFTGSWKTQDATAMSLTMEVERADHEHVTPYMCEFTYYKNDDPDNWSTRTEVFVEDTEVMEKAPVNIVTPNPIVIGEAMEVKCSVHSVGGVAMLPSIGPEKIVSKMQLSRTIAGKTERIAKYDVFIIPPWTKVVIFRPKGVSDITMGGGKEERYPNAGDVRYPNVDTINITMKVVRATCDHVATYKCELWYDIPSDGIPYSSPQSPRTWLKVFTENTTATKNGRGVCNRRPGIHYAHSRGDGKLQPPALLVSVVLGLCQLVHYM